MSRTLWKLSNKLNRGQWFGHWGLFLTACSIKEVYIPVQKADPILKDHANESFDPASTTTRWPRLGPPVFNLLRTPSNTFIPRPARRHSLASNLQPQPPAANPGRANELSGTHSYGTTNPSNLSSKQRVKSKKRGMFSKIDPAQYLEAL